MEDIFNSDSIRLKKLLPPELWKLVAETLLKLGSNDIESLANCSKFFTQLLASQRTTYLAEKVFDNVAISVWNKNNLEGLPVSDVVKLRGACSHWNAVIDKLIFEKFRNYRTFSTDQRTSNPFSIMVLDPVSTYLVDDSLEYSAESIQKFLRHFEESHPSNQINRRSPLIWGKVKLEIEGFKEDEIGFGDCQRLLQSISALLSKYGRHIEDLDLSLFNYNVVDGVTEAQRWREWFVNVPNLKKLTIYGVNCWNNGVFPALELPKLNKLIKLDIYGMLDPLFDQLVRQSSNISTIVVEDVDTDFDFFTFCLPNLKNLKLYFISDALVDKLNCYVQWPLESLALDISQIVIDCGCDKLLQVIQNKFANTLVSLEFTMKHLHIKKENIWQAFYNCRLYMPKLRKVSLFVYKVPACLDFLLPMRHNLEEIRVEVNYEVPYFQLGTFTSGSIVQFTGFEHKIMCSNIWAIFKRLKCISIKTPQTLHGSFKRYSREDWMIYNDYV